MIWNPAKASPTQEEEPGTAWLLFSLGKIFAPLRNVGEKARARNLQGGAIYLA